MVQLKILKDIWRKLYFIIVILTLVECVQLYTEVKSAVDGKRQLLKTLYGLSAVQCALRCTLLCSCTFWSFSSLKRECHLMNESLIANAQHESINPTFKKAIVTENKASCFKSCHRAQQSGHLCSSVYLLCPSIPVYCDMETDGGGWALIQKRMDGIERFNRFWMDYKQGFGDITKGHWLGLDNIRALLSHQQQSVLRFDLYSWEGEHREAEYSIFEVGDESSKYTLKVGGYSGNAGDSMAYHNGFKFSSIDQDNDPYGQPCSLIFGHGGWWYDRCHTSNPNGHYFNTSTCPFGVGVIWYHWKGHYYSLKGVQIKIREFK